MPKSAPTTTIAFRVSLADERRLSMQASANGQTPGEYAREVTLERLEDRDTMARQVSRLEHSLQEYRDDFAKAIEALMVLMTRKEPMTNDQIKSWVDSRLRHK